MEDSEKDKLINHLKLLKYMGIDEIDRELKENQNFNNKEEEFEKIREEVENCKLCKLHKGRKNAVFGEGNRNADIMFVGEAPGRQEDIQGKPFVGAAGQKLDEAIKRVGLQREDVFITNVVKCRPPGNRNPTIDEITSCNGYLRRQIKLINPEIMIFMGNIALSLITGKASGITKMRGHIMEYLSRRVIPTFHPAYITRNPGSFNTLVSDLKKATGEL